MTADQPTSAPDGATVEAELRSYGISVESVQVDGGQDRTSDEDRASDEVPISEGRDGLRLTYMTAFPGREVHRREVGRACNALLDMAEAAQWEPADVEATVVRAPGDVLGHWRAEREWFEELLAGTISETRFSERVVATIDNVEGEAA